MHYVQNLDSLLLHIDEENNIIMMRCAIRYLRDKMYPRGYRLLGFRCHQHDIDNFRLLVTVIIHYINY